MTVTDLSNKPTLIGDRVVLRPIVASDAAHMWADVYDDEANRLTGTHADFTRDQIEQWCASRSEAADRLDLAVVDTATGSWAGEVVISEWDAENRSCSFRIALGAGARNRGLGSEATRLIVDHAFDHLDVNRIALEVYVFNPRAIAVYEKVGFRREGVLREALLWDGEYVDAIVMSMLRDDRAPHDTAGSR